MPITPLRAARTAIFGYDNFLSYPHEDAKDYAAALRRALVASDYRVFIDRAEAPAGARLRRVLGTALRSSSAFVLLDSPAAHDSRYVRIELRYARRFGIPIIPLALGGSLAATTGRGRAETIYVPEPYDALDDGEPSSEAVAAVVNAIALRRRNSIRRALVSAAVLAVAVVGLLAL